MRNAIVLLSFLLLIWIAGSSYVYVCKIRKDCCAEKTAVVDSMAIKQAIADSLQAAAAVPQIPVPGMYTLYFDFNKGTCEITAENSSHFELIKQYLAATSGKKVLVTGHSDSIGPESAKEKVSARRADYVKQKLAEAGIALEAIATASESDRKPFADNGTREGRAKNRRAEIIIQ
jgi:outer membrane protein OmpA-like peptidoglycan-associated protein